MNFHFNLIFFNCYYPISNIRFFKGILFLRALFLLPDFQKFFSLAKRHVKNQIRFDSTENKAAMEPPLKELIEFGKNL